MRLQEKGVDVKWKTRLSRMSNYFFHTGNSFQKGKKHGKMAFVEKDETQSIGQLQ